MTKIRHPKHEAYIDTSPADAMLSQLVADNQAVDIERRINEVEDLYEKGLISSRHYSHFIDTLDQAKALNASHREELQERINGEKPSIGRRIIRFLVH